jgi:hypothetical protein
MTKTKKRARPRLWTFVALTPRRIIVKRLRCTEREAELEAVRLRSERRIADDELNWHLLPGHLSVEVDA